MKTKFKKGDKVFVINNSAWGLRPMKIVSTDQWGGACCKHPDFSGEGFFRVNKLVPFNSTRQKQVNKLNKMMKEVEKYKKELFGRDLG